jgi:hypothetical protein
VGFAEFASTLISETLNAVVTSILTQEKQAAQLEHRHSYLLKITLKKT